MANSTEPGHVKGKSDAARASELKVSKEQGAGPQTSQVKTEPKLRHEFVGMMFALAIGEVGVQTAALVRTNNWVHFLPAYCHLFLATVVIAASWVGWTLSPAPGARQDVRSIFTRDFLVLLVDVFLVVVYFILVKTVDITGEKDIQLDASARPETLWILVIFGTYCFWDVLTKVLDYLKKGHKGLAFKEWFKKYGVRMIPTIICFVALIFTKPLFDRADPPHVLTADLALLSLVLLFRALKGLTQLAIEPKMPKGWLIFWTTLCLLGFGVGTKWTCSWPIPKSIADEIQMIPDKEKIHSETPTTSTQDSQSAKPEAKAN
jgi:hypothetical protein